MRFVFPNEIYSGILFFQTEFSEFFYRIISLIPNESDDFCDISF